MKVVGKQVAFIRATETNARNGEGDFIRLKNGAIMYAYSAFLNGGGDFDKSLITAIYSYDEGETFTDKRVLFDLEEGETQNLCVSFLRLKNGDIAIFYGVRGKRQDVMMRVSSDEGLTFSKPTPIINKEGYYVFENGRVLRSKSGRILIPLNKHEIKENGGIGAGHFVLFYSDDDGKTWIDSNNYISHPDGEIWQGLQETGLTQFD
ncbi:MAG: exo-alpha-sialidase, partial [Clostridia bacterium]|nr:exo-alpha-sialidase [Clostridia bacterium]